MTHLPGFDIRYTYATDAPYLTSWLSEPGMLHWFPMSEGKEMEDAVACWIGFCRYSASITATIEDVPVGIGTLFLMPYRKVAHHCLFKLVVDPKYHRKGIATALLRNLMHLAKNYFHLELLHIEVFEGNPIIELLKKQGFKEFGRQTHFVKEEEHFLGRILLEVDL
jgi:putative acetyltransferase